MVITQYDFMVSCTCSLQISCDCSSEHVPRILLLEPTEDQETYPACNCLLTKKGSLWSIKLTFISHIFEDVNSYFGVHQGFP